MPSLINFSVSTGEALSMVEDAITYANTITRNLLYETGLNSPYRILLEAQVYVYDRFLVILKNAERELRLIFFELLGFAPLTATNAKVRLKFELVETRSNENTYFRSGFPVKAENGIIFLTDTILVIPPNAKLGYVNATSTRPGIDGNLPPFKINSALQTIDVSFTVTNESRSSGGRNGESLDTLSNRVGQYIRRNGLISEKDWYDFVNELNPRIVSSIISEDPYTIEIYACMDDGAALPTADLSRLNQELQLRKPLGVELITIAPIEVLTTTVKVIGSIRNVGTDVSIASDINSRLRSWLRPSNIRQVQGNARGIVLHDDLLRIIHQSQIDYVHSISIGINADTAYGQNFVFDAIVQRVKLGLLEVTLINGDYDRTYTFTN